jgi:hypothetical protein
MLPQETLALPRDQDEDLVGTLSFSESFLWASRCEFVATLGAPGCYHRGMQHSGGLYHRAQGEVDQGPGLASPTSQLRTVNA